MAPKSELVKIATVIYSLIALPATLANFQHLMHLTDIYVSGSMSLTDMWIYVLSIFFGLVLPGAIQSWFWTKAIAYVKSIFESF